MRKLTALASMTAAALLFFPSAIFAQEKQDKDKSENAVDHGSVDIGLRYSWGDVYGRQDLQTGQCLGCGTPFTPNLTNSKFGEYRDMRNGLYLRRVDLKYENILNTKNYFSIKSSKTLYRDQSYLATLGHYGKYKIQFRYDEIPHTYSDTTRTLFTQTSLGVWSFPALIRQALQNPVPVGSSLQSIINTQVVPQSNFITPAILRRAGTVSFSYDWTANLNLNGLFWRESQRGNRPQGFIMNSSPSASATSGFGVELPETINYFNNLVRFGGDYGRRSWDIAAAYIGSFFQDGSQSMLWDNPFRLTTEQVANPLTGRSSLYPNNNAQYFSFAGAADLTRYMHFTASITPGWLHQNQAFLPYTSNTAITTCGAAANQACDTTAVLPATSLNAQKQTLAMNYNLVTTAWKSFEIKTSYRQYDYNNNTPILNFTPVEGDAAAPGAAQNTAFGFNRKTVEVSGNWYFAKKSSLKAGYVGEWMDRSHRDVDHSMENTFLTALDWVPFKDLQFRVSYAHSDRKPDNYQDDNATDPVTLAPVVCSDTTDVSFTADQRCSRRFDEAARLRNRGDASIQYNLTDKLTLSAFGGTLQDNFNRVGGTNSPVPLNFLTGSLATTSPYYLYGVLKDISYNYGFDADYALMSQVTFFAEYSHERYYKRIISRYRTPTATGQTILTCAGCDSANNDWQSVTREPVDIYSGGLDFYFGKKTTFTTYYSLSATKGNVLSQPLGDPTILTGANQFLLTGTNAAVDYPETVNRLHEFAVVFKYKIRENLTPKIEYRYQQWDNKDYQTSVMTQYMGCVSSPPPAAPVPGCTTPILNSSTSAAPLPGATSPFYPYFVVGDPSAARYLFLGVDQPSYHAHTLTASLEYRF